MTYSVLCSGPQKERRVSWKRDYHTSSPTFEVHDSQVTDLKFPKEKTEPAASSTCLCLAFHTDPEALASVCGRADVVLCLHINCNSNYSWCACYLISINTISAILVLR